MRHTRKQTSKVLSVKVPRELSARVARLARERHTTVSEVVRDALEHYEAPGQGRSFHDAASHFIGSHRVGPKDLSTHPRHLKGFGED